MYNNMGSMLKQQPKFVNFRLPILPQNQPPFPTQNPPKFLLSSKLPQKSPFKFPPIGLKSKTKQQPCSYKLPAFLTVLSYNIWFQSHNMQTRYACIIKMLQNSKADFICLQQVTQQFMQMLSHLPSNSWLSQYYTATIPMGWYDTLILSKYKCQFYQVPFKTSYMGRSMLFAEMAVQGLGEGEGNGKEGNGVVVGCMHYESLAENGKIRAEQIQSVQEMTREFDRVIIVGDFNFSDGYQENNVVDKNFTDLWIKKHGLKDNSYTMPKTPKFSEWRPDHILCKMPQTINFQNSQIQKIGDFSIPPFEKDHILKIQQDDLVRTPSDHYGLIARIPLK